MAIELAGKGKRVRIYLSEDDKVGHASAPQALLAFFRRNDAMGATVLRGVAGFGASGELHTSNVVDIVQHLPVVVEWIDQVEAVERLLPQIKAMVPRGLVTMDDTDILLYEPHPVRDLQSAVTVADVMSREIESATRGTPVQQVVEKMLGKLYRAVPVVESGAPVGIVTNTDLVKRGGLGVRLDLLASLEKPELHTVLARLAQSNMVAADVMTPSPVTVQSTASLPDAAALMSRRHLKRLPVVGEDGNLAGMVSRLDLLRAAANGFAEKAVAPRDIGLAGDTPLSRVMRRDFPQVHPETPLPEVFQAVIATRLNRALVVDSEHRVVGLVTDAELLDRVTPSLRPGALRALMNRLPFVHPKLENAETVQHARAHTAAELMTTHVAVARESSLLRDAIALMLDGSHKVLAVTDAEGHLVGIVDRADLLHGLLPPSGP